MMIVCNPTATGECVSAPLDGTVGQDVNNPLSLSDGGLRLHRRFNG
jgi:hypothetical protein